MVDNLIPLHNHSEYSNIASVADAYSSVEMIVDRAVALGQRAVGLTDHGVVAGHMALAKAAKAKGLIPIFGSEDYLVDSPERVRAEKDRQNSHLCLWARNKEGLSNLWALSSLGFEQKYYKPLIGLKDLKQYGSGLMVSDGCALADMARYIIAEQDDKARQLISNYWQAVGEENFYMELHTFRFMGETLSEKQLKINSDIHKMNLGKIELAQSLGVPLIAVNDSHYAEEADWEKHQLVWAMSTQNTDKSEDGRTAAWMMSSDEMVENLGAYGIPSSVALEAIANTSKIADRVEEIEFGTAKHIPLMTGTRDGDLALFRDSIEKGFEKKIAPLPVEQHLTYVERIEFEQQLLEKYDLFSYYLIVSDFMRWAKSPKPNGEPGWLCGVARGSGMGSLIAYAMDIIEGDPIEHDIPFARFLTEARVRGYLVSAKWEPEFHIVSIDDRISDPISSKDCDIDNGSQQRKIP